MDAVVHPFCFYIIYIQKRRFVAATFAAIMVPVLTISVNVHIHTQDMPVKIRFVSLHIYLNI